MAWVLAATLSGCAILLPRPGRPPETPAAPVPLLAAEEVIERLEGRRRALGSFRALSELRYEAPDERLHVSQTVLVDRPGRIRIEVLSAFGIAAVITVDDEDLRAYHRGDGTFYHGHATRTNIARLTRLPLDVREATALLVGLPPNALDGSVSDAAFEPETRLWRLAGPLAGGGTQTVWVSPEDLRPVRVLVSTSEGLPRFEARFEDYVDTDAGAVPTGIVLEDRIGKTRVRLAYSRLEVNLPTEARHFRLEQPASARIVDLDR